MKFVERLEKIDRRIIFLVILLAVVIPLLFPIGFKIEVSGPVRRLHETVEALPPGARVLMSFDYGPATMPEVYPMNQALVRHCFEKNLRVIGLALWPEGVSLAQEAMEIAAEEFDKEYGVDYVNLGYKAGGIVVISAVAESLSLASSLSCSLRLSTWPAAAFSLSFASTTAANSALTLSSDSEGSRSLSAFAKAALTSANSALCSSRSLSAFAKAALIVANPALCSSRSL